VILRFGNPARIAKFTRKVHDREKLVGVNQRG